MTDLELRAFQRGMIMKQLHLYKPYLKSFSDIISPLFDVNRKTILAPLKYQETFCDGILIPKYPFKKTYEAKTFLQDQGINICNMQVSRKEGYYWTRPVDNSLGLDTLLEKLCRSGDKMRDNVLKLKSGHTTLNLPKDAYKKTLIVQVDLS